MEYRLLLLSSVLQRYSAFCPSLHCTLEIVAFHVSVLCYLLELCLFLPFVIKLHVGVHLRFCCCARFLEMTSNFGSFKFYRLT